MDTHADQSLVPQTPHPLVTPEESPFMPGWGPEDYAPPELKLVQGQSRAHTEDGVELGKFHCAQTGETKDLVRLVILRAQRTRVLWPDTLGPPECASDDRVVPRPGGKYPGPCGDCPVRNDAPWLLSDDEKRNYCLPAYTLLVLDLENGQPYLLRVNGTSVQGFKGLWTTFALGYKSRPFAAEVELTSQKRSNERGTFYIMTPRVVKPFPPEDVAHYQEMAQAMMGVRLTAQEEPQEEGEVAVVSQSAAPEGEAPVAPPQPAAALQEWRGKLTDGPFLQYTPEGEPTASLTLDAGEGRVIRATARGGLAERLHQLVPAESQVSLMVHPLEDGGLLVVSFHLLEDPSASMEERRQVTEAARAAGFTTQEARQRLQRMFPGARGTADLSRSQAMHLLRCLRGEEPWPWEIQEQAPPAQPKQEELPF